MDIEYLKSLFTQIEIERYCFDDDNSDFDKTIFIDKLISEFDKFIKELYTEIKLYHSTNINYLLSQICLFFKHTINLNCLFFKHTINLNVNYSISTNKNLSLKIENIIFISDNNNPINRVITDMEQSFEKLFLYILEIKKEINSYITGLKNYPYLHQYVNITDFEILLHYSNIIE